MSERHSIVIPVYNEAPNLARLHARVSRVIDALEGEWEVILVDDGSQDATGEVIDALHARDPRFKALHLSRNFGHQIAISAGLAWSEGDTVTVMDGDLQDPPELLGEFLARWREGFMVVYGVRRRRDGETWFKRATAAAFYRWFNRIATIRTPVDAGDFRLLDRKVVDALVALPEKARYMRGLSSWVGYRQTGVPYDREPRAQGKSHFNVGRMLRFAWDGVTSFSRWPLRLIAYASLAVGASTALVGAGAVGAHFAWGTRLAPFGLPLLVGTLGALQLGALGIIGDYVGRVHAEVQGRPLYVVGRAVGFAPRAAERAPTWRKGA